MSAIQLPQLETQGLSADVQRQQIGEVYARAFLASIQSDSQAEEILRQLGEFVKVVVERLPEFQTMLAAPRIPAEEKIGILDRVLGSRVHTLLLRFLKVIARHGRLDCLREIYAASRKLWNVGRGIVEVKVTTAQPLDQQVRSRIEESLTQKLKSAIEVRSHVDPSLIGGIAIRVGDQVFDGSVAQRLRRMAAETVDQTVATIRSQSQRFTSESNA